MRLYIKKLPIYVSEKTGAGKTDSKNVLTWIAKNRNPHNLTDIGEILKEQIDVRLFGGISTLKDKLNIKMVQENGKEKDVELTNYHVQFTGPVQFALLNPSLNKVDLRMHQNTTHFTSKADNSQGSIGTTTLVPYSIIQIHGWVNPAVAQTTGMKEEDLKLMFEGIWYGTTGEGSSFSRSKIGQNSVLLLEIIYSKQNAKVYGVDKLIKIVPKDNKKDEQLRCMNDYDFDFSELIKVSGREYVEKIRYYTEIQQIKDALKGDKFEEITL